MCFECPPVAVPPARLATGNHDRVTELRPAAVEVIVDDEASADARAEREHDQIGRTAPRAEPHSASAAAFPSFSTPAGME